MIVATLLAVLLVGQPDTPTHHATIPDLPQFSPKAAAAVSSDVERQPQAAPSEDTTYAKDVEPAETEPHVWHIPEPWASLADCESGDWIDGGASFVERSARWDWGAPGMTLPPWGTSIHHGGLQFAPSTWEWVAGDLGLLGEYPAAYDAPPEIQVDVASEVQARQGWAAWPVCSRKVGLR